MKNFINIDIGGTFTDCYLINSDKVAYSKAPTTRHNLSRGLVRVIKQCAEELDISLEQVLQETDLIKYATTLAMNALLEHKGPKLGLITTAGYEDTIYIGKASQWWDALPLELAKDVRRAERPEPLIPRDMVVGLRERVDCFGEVIIPLSREEIQEQLQYLVNRGAMGFVVSLIWSFVNPEHEQMIKEVIREEYPDYYLGSQPILLSSEVCAKKNEYERTMTTVLTAYLHRAMAEELTELSNELKDQKYKGSLAIVHNTGGMASLYETSSVKTYNAGPVAGLAGGQGICDLYDSEFKDVIMTDMGGTSFDIGVLVDSKLRFYDFVPLIDWWRVSTSMIETKSIGAGGGSIAWINESLGNTIEVGPESAGSMPGPAAYDQGGDRPTVTDADIVLGYVNPDNFLGGKMKLNKDKAYKTIRDKIARPAGMEVEEAAMAIKRIIDANMGNEIFKETNLKGYDPREFALFAYGGAGATHCCGYATFVESPVIVTFPFSSVFSAFGVSCMDYLQIYEKTSFMIFFDAASESYTDEYDLFNDVVKELKDKAIQDARKQGFRTGDIVFELELEMRYGLQPNITRVRAPKSSLNSKKDAVSLGEAFTNAYNISYGEASSYPEGGVEIVNFIMRSIIPVPKFNFPKLKSKGRDSKKALKGKRPVFWQETKGFRKTNIYELEALKCGNIVDGPAVIEARDTTYVINPGKRFRIDNYLNGIIEEIK